MDDSNWKLFLPKWRRDLSKELLHNLPLYIKIVSKVEPQPTKMASHLSDFHEVENSFL